MGEGTDFLPMDLEWTRSSQIRLAIAGLFDDPMAANALEHMTAIRIVVHPEHRMAGLQLLAWVIQRTGWIRSMELGLDDGHADVFYFETHEGCDLTASMETEPSSAPLGLIEFQSPQCCLRVTREAGSPYLHQQLEAGLHQIDRCTPANSDDPAELVMNQLSRGGKNTFYRMMMPVFLDLLGGEDDCPALMSVR